MNIFSILTLGALRFADDGAVFHGTQQVCTWAQLRSRALRLASGMRDHVPLGGRVAVVAKNCPEYVEILFAAWAAGLVIVPINAKLHAREVEDILTDSGATLLFASNTQALWSDKQPQGLRIVTIGSADYDAMLDLPETDCHDAAPDDLAWLFYTSGTTGRSKGAMLSHRNLMAMAIAHLADFEDVAADHGLLHAAPMSHGSGLYILPYVMRAARQIVPASGRFEPEEVLDLCAHHGQVGMFLAPTMVQRLRLTLEETGRKADGLRRIIYGGGPMYLEEIRKALVTLGPVFCQLYGQGEAPMTITGLRPGDFDDADDATLASVGWPRSGVEVSIFDSDDRPVPPGTVGEIVCRGDVVMGGYWHKEEATRATLAGGWLHTGDMGSLDADGKLTLSGRSKEVIISGGTNIYPREVEEALLTHPAVREVAVVGRPNPEWGEDVVAFIATATGEALDRDELDRHCLDRIARFKRPKDYVFLPDLPKSSYGKILKRELTAHFADLPA